MAFYRNFTHATLVVTDATGTPLSETVDIDDGTIQINDMVPGQRETSDYERKGRWISSAYTARKYATVALACNHDVLKNTSTGTLFDMIFGTSGTPYSARVSTIAPTGATAGKVPIALNWALTIEGTEFGDSADQTITLAKGRIESVNFAEGDPNKITISIKVLGAITGDIAQSEA